MLRRYWPWILFAVLLVVGLGRLRFDADVLHLLPEELPVVRGLQLQQQYFANSRELVITVAATDPEAASLAARRLAESLGTQNQLVRAVRWQPPWKERPADGLENLAWMWLQQPPEALAALSARLSPTRLPAELAAAREVLATSLDPQELARTGYDPLGLTRIPGAPGSTGGWDEGTGIFVSEDGTFRLVFIEPARRDLNYREAGAWLSSVRALSEKAVASGDPGVPAGVRLGFTGSPAFVGEISGGMESDLKSSVLSTLLLIAGLFWAAHRTWRPLGWLVLSLGLTLILTLALGGLFFGTLNVISVGFAAVLLGLAVDYGLVSYQEAVAHPGVGPDGIRHEVSRGIWYSAGTTAGTFLLLGFAGLPGLAQLGQLTALGLLVGALVMLYFFLPRVCPVPVPAGGAPGEEETITGRVTRWNALAPTALMLVGIAAILGWRGLPVLTASDDPLRPRHSTAYAAMDELRERLGRTREPLRLMVQGPDAAFVARQLEATAGVLTAARERGEVTSFELPTGFWPRPINAATNQSVALRIAAGAEEIRTAVLAAGFSTNAVTVLDEVFAAWKRLPPTPIGAWPTNGTAQWLSGQFAARTGDGGWLAMGAVFPGAAWTGDFRLAGLPPGVLLSSWDSLSTRLMEHVRRRVTLLSALIAVVLAGCLWLAFRRGREVLLSFVALGVSLALLLAFMTVVDWSWNLLSLVALPLLLGTSVDSTIHVQLALRRHRGERRAVWRTTGKALLLCAAANIAGFGSLAWSSNRGLASMDLVCAAGVACVFAVCVGLLPAWWRIGVGPETGQEPPATAGPSALYGAVAWRWGQTLTRALPRSLTARLAELGVTAYRRLLPARFAVVVGNLRPVVGDAPGVAEQTARENFRQFARKLVDLWRQEAGVPDAGHVEPAAGWEHFRAARAAGRGVLLVTPHLGNWEFGSSLLAKEGVRPLVLTAPEPGGRFTELRAAARARLGVDTLVVGADPFAFVEVIRRLQSGGMVALLLDRPPAATAVEVEFLGRPFRASIAAAELARASGAVVLPVYIVRQDGAYRAHALAPVTYDRRDLGDRTARVAFTGRILRAFEPAVRQFPAQWFHFVPVWGSDAAPRRSE